MNSKLIGLLALLLMGCADAPRLEHQAAQLVGVGVSVDRTTYAVGDPIRLSWSGFSPASPTDWVGLARVGDSDTIWWTFAYTAGQSSGNRVIEHMPPGNWVARAYIQDSYTKLAESPPFTITGPPPTLTVVQPSTGWGSPVAVAYSGFPGNVKDYVALVSAGRPGEGGILEWYYLGGATSGQIVFHPTGGQYEIRGYFNDSQRRLATSSAFAAGVQLTTDAASYELATSITVRWSGMTTDPGDWIALAQESMGYDTNLSFFYTNGATSGTRVLPPLPVGRYSLRAYHANTYQVMRESDTFEVFNTAQVSTNARSYTRGDTVTVSFAGMPGGTGDWVGIVPDADPTTIVQWAYTNSTVSGTHAFSALQPGTYRARVYNNDRFAPLAESLSFVIGGATIATDASVYVSGATVSVRFSGLEGRPRDWIGISTQGSSASAYVSYRYTGGVSSGTQVFSGLAPGSYVARAYLDDSFSIIVESAAFVIQ